MYLLDEVMGPKPATAQILGEVLAKSLRSYLDAIKSESLNVPWDSSEATELRGAWRTSGRVSLETRTTIMKLAQEICATVWRNPINPFFNGVLFVKSWIKHTDSQPRQTGDPEIDFLVQSLQFHFCSCLKVALDLKLHEHIPKAGFINASDLAALVGADESLLVRILRVLTDKNVFAERRPGNYCHTRMSLVMCKPNEAYLIQHRLDEGLRSSANLPQALARIGYREPASGDLLAFNLAFGTSQSFWDFMKNSDPERGQNMARAMSAVKMNGLEVIPALYPFDKLVPDGGLLVDVGGGMGQVSRTILSVYPDIGLRCIVQDAFAAGNVCEDVTDLTIQVHDFFDAQPVKDAAAYFFRHIMHDWPDGACITILKRTVEAMSKCRSRILICDQVVSENDSSSVSGLYDIDMMALFGGKERTMKQWRSLLERADPRLYINDVKRTPKAHTTILEVLLR